MSKIKLATPFNTETDNLVNKQPRTLDRTISVLEQALGSSPAPSAATITDTLGLPRPTVNRIISNLVNLGLLKRDPLSRALAPDHRMVELALQTLTRCTEHSVVKKILESLSTHTNETCNLGTIVDGQVQYLNRIESRWPLAFRLGPGGTVPLHCSAQGKLLLGAMPENVREQYLKAIDYIPYTGNSITTVEAMRAEIEHIRNAGYATDNEEYLEGLIGIAVQVPLKTNSAPLALAIAAPSARVSHDSLTDYLPVMYAAADKITELFAH